MNVFSLENPSNMKLRKKDYAQRTRATQNQGCRIQML